MRSAVLMRNGHATRIHGLFLYVYTYIYIYVLVGGDWNMTFIFPYIGSVIIPIDELIFFRGVGQSPTSLECSYSSQLMGCATHAL